MLWLNTSRCTPVRDDAPTPGPDRQPQAFRRVETKDWIADVKPFMIAGGLIAHAGQGVAIDSASKPGDRDWDDVSDYRFQIWQGTPPFGTAPEPTLVDYGRGLLPTYLRIELRRGMKPGRRSSFDATYDEWYYDWSRKDRDDRGRCRFEIKTTASDAPAVITGPNRNKTRAYEWQIYLSPLWSGEHLRAAGTTPQGSRCQTAIKQLYQKNTRIHPTLYAPNDGSADFDYYRPGIVAGSFTIDPSVDQAKGRWWHVRDEIVYHGSSGSSRVFVNGQQQQYKSGLNTWNAQKMERSYPKLGLYQTHTVGVPNRPDGRRWNSTYYVEGERELVAWYTGWRFWDNVR